MDDLKLLADSERQSQLQQPSMSIYDERKRIDSDGTASFEFHLQNDGHLEQNSLAPSVITGFNVRAQCRVPEGIASDGRPPPYTCSMWCDVAFAPAEEAVFSGSRPHAESSRCGSASTCESESWQAQLAPIPLRTRLADRFPSPLHPATAMLLRPAPLQSSKSPQITIPCSSPPPRPAHALPVMHLLRQKRRSPGHGHPYSVQPSAHVPGELLRAPLAGLSRNRFQPSSTLSRRRAGERAPRLYANEGPRRNTR